MSEESEFCTDDESIEDFQDTFDKDFNLESIPHNFLVLTYIGGFFLSKLILKHYCSTCKSQLETDKEIAVDPCFDFVKEEKIFINIPSFISFHFINIPSFISFYHQNAY